MTAGVGEPSDNLRQPFETPASWDRFEQRSEHDFGLPELRPDDVAENIRALDGSNVYVAQESAGYMRAGLADVRHIFGRLRRDSHQVLKTKEFRTGSGARHLGYRQFLDGIPIEGAAFSVHELDGRPFALSGTPLQTEFAREPSRAHVADHTAPNKDRIQEMISAMFGVVGHIHQARRMLLPVDGALHPVTRVRFTAPDAIDVEAFFAVPSGELLLSYNVSAARNADALVYRINPLRTPDLVKVTLTGMSEPDDGRLQGSMVVSRPGVPPAFVRYGGDLRLQPDDAGFDEIQAYFHVMSAIAFFERLIPGLGSRSPFNPVIAISHDPDAERNAYWEPDSKTLRFGDFSTRPSARSADMVYHEVGHAVSERAADLQRGARDTQARGLSEGYSDYFSCSAFNDPTFGDYVQNNSDGARRCDKATVRFAHDFVGKEHATGEVWANVLWDCRSQLGDAHMDAVAIESLPLLSKKSTFLDARSALVAGDQALHGADAAAATAHATVFMNAFAQRWP